MQLAEILVSPSHSVREVIACIERNARGIVLIVDGECRLAGTVTDGDIRRAILAGMNLNVCVMELLARKADSPYNQPVTATVGTSPTALLRLMQERTVRHVPLLDSSERVVDLVTLDELLQESVPPLQAVIMAGGFGTRLRPLTDQLPKPMLPVDGRPLLELIVEQLRQAGVRRVNVTTHYRGDAIVRHFRDGRDFGVEINYVTESQPLGTAGALSLLDRQAEPLLVMNGDILTRVDFNAMINFHREHKADMTVAVREYELRVPYGVIETDGVEVVGVSEKPVLRRFINAGIYLLNSDVCQFVPIGQPYNMPDLIVRLLANGRRVISFPIHEYWLDIGQVEDYQRGLADVGKGQI